MLRLKDSSGPCPGGSVSWTSPCTPKGCGFDPRSGHVQEATGWCFFHIGVSLSISEINKHALRRGLKITLVHKNWCFTLSVRLPLRTLPCTSERRKRITSPGEETAALVRTAGAWRAAGTSWWRRDPAAASPSPSISTVPDPLRVLSSAVGREGGLHLRPSQNWGQQSEGLQSEGPPPPRRDLDTLLPSSITLQWTNP